MQTVKHFISSSVSSDLLGVRFMLYTESVLLGNKIATPLKISLQCCSSRNGCETHYSLETRSCSYSSKW